MAFLALAVCFLLVANSVPPTVFMNEAFWLWAGRAMDRSGYYRVVMSDRSRAQRHDPRTAESRHGRSASAASASPSATCASHQRR